MNSTTTLPRVEGKVYRRKSDGFILEGGDTLGYTYYIGGQKLKTPHWETVDDYELIDAPVEETTEEAEIINE